MDMRIEPSVREAFAAVIAEDSDRLDRALQALAALDEDDLMSALRLASGVLYVILYRLQNRKPTGKELEQVATELMDAASWLPLRHDDVVTLFTAHVDGHDLSSLKPAAKAAGLLFMVTGGLVGGCAPTGQRWEDFLDECENLLDGRSARGDSA